MPRCPAGLFHLAPLFTVKIRIRRRGPAANCDISGSLTPVISTPAPLSLRLSLRLSLSPPLSLRLSLSASLSGSKQAPTSVTNVRGGNYSQGCRELREMALLRISPAPNYRVIDCPRAGFSTLLIAFCFDCPPPCLRGRGGEKREENPNHIISLT